MNEAIRNYPPKQVLPAVGNILRHQGIPADARINMRTEILIMKALQMFSYFAKPTAVTKLITAEEFELVYAGEGNNQSDDPLAEIYGNSSNLFLFTATVGMKVSDEIGRLMNEGDLAEGSLLDSVASEAVDGLAEIVQNECALQVMPNSQTKSEGVMRFSPGYCGWDISGQKKLFEILKPNSIGVTLSERYLMQPLKSVSGVIVVAPKSCFEFENDFIFCFDCRNPSCQERYQEMLTRTLE